MSSLHITSILSFIHSKNHLVSNQKTEEIYCTRSKILWIKLYEKMVKKELE
jgi:hypothetical protein